MKILAVDDEPFIRELLIETLRPLGYDIAEAGDGFSALQLVESFRPAIVILDVSMPGLDGYGVLKRLREMEHGQRAFVLMLTARAELDDLERGISSGADDFLPKPFQLRELAARIQAAARVQALQEELLRKNRQLSESLAQQERLNRKMTAEMQMAARLQAAILSPGQFDSGWTRIRIRYKPSTAIGGDFYELRPLGANRVGILLADAVGHGVSAALLGAMLKTAFEDALAPSTAPASVMGALNRSFQFCAEQGKYLAAFFGILDSNSGELSYALAGHVPPLVHRVSDGSVEKLDAPGFCLGLFEQGGYEERSIRLLPGDHLFLCTDGASEASCDDRQTFGRRLPALLRSSPGLDADQLLDRVDAALLEFLGASPLNDDYTLLCVQILKHHET